MNMTQSLYSWRLVPTSFLPRAARGRMKEGLPHKGVSAKQEDKE
jgi:hypothetical protein